MRTGRPPPVVTTAPDRGCSRRLGDLLPFRLQCVQEADGTLRVGCGLEDGPFVAGKHRQPRLQVGCVVLPRFQLGRDAEIGA